MAIPCGTYSKMEREYGAYLSSLIGLILVAKQYFMSELLIMIFGKACRLCVKYRFKDIILCVILGFLSDSEGLKAQTMANNLASLFREQCIVPDVITVAPSEVLTIKYPNGTAVETGKELTPTQVKDQPVVTWAAKEQDFYLLAMVDPDAPSREDPKFREWHHWLVGNILGSQLGKGEVLSDYIGSGPPKGTGLHRYVFLVYRQPEKLDFSKVQKLPNNSGDKRGKFSIAKFAQNFKLGTPVAGNFYVAKYDNYVPKLYAKLKG